MSKADDLIERMERETGSRVDDPDSPALAGLLGAIARELGHNKFGPQDDVAVGTLITRRGNRNNQADAVFVNLLINGFSPDDVKVLSDLLKDD